MVVTLSSVPDTLHTLPSPPEPRTLVGLTLRPLERANFHGENAPAASSSGKLSESDDSHVQGTWHYWRLHTASRRLPACPTRPAICPSGFICVILRGCTGFSEDAGFDPHAETAEPHSTYILNHTTVNQMWTQLIRDVITFLELVTLTLWKHYEKVTTSEILKQQIFRLFPSNFLRERTSADLPKVFSSPLLYDTSIDQFSCQLRCFLELVWQALW